MATSGTCNHAAGTVIGLNWSVSALLTSRGSRPVWGTIGRPIEGGGFEGPRPLGRSRAQRLAPFGIGTVHGYGYRLEAEDRRRLMGMIEEHFVNKDFASKDNRERAIRCSDCSRSKGKIVEMAPIRIEPSGVSG